MHDPWTTVAVPMGKATKTCLSRCVGRCAHVVLRARCGTFSTCQKMCSCRFARHTGHFVTFDVCFRWHVCA